MAEAHSVMASAVTLIRRDDAVLMVESRYPGEVTFWALPGGLLDRGEDVADALAREVREETGLSVVDPHTVAALIWLKTDEGAPDWLTFICEPAGWDGTIDIDDPDGVTLQAASCRRPMLRSGCLLSAGDLVRPSWNASEERRSGACGRTGGTAVGHGTVPDQRCSSPGPQARPAEGGEGPTTLRW